MDTSRNDMLGELAADAALERTDFLVQAAEQLRRVPRGQPRPDLRARRSDAHRRRPRLPVDRARPHVPEPEPLPGRPDRRVDQRDRGHRELVRARRAVQPGRRVPGVRRGRARSGRPAAEPTATDDLLDAAGIAPDETLPAQRRRSRTPPRPTSGRRRAAPTRRGRLRRGGRTRLYDLALDYQERSQRAEARLLDQFEDAAGGFTRAPGRPDHRRRRGRAAHARGRRRVPGRGRARGGRGRVADARDARRARRVLRPDRRVRRPGRRARRGVPGGRGRDRAGRRGRRPRGRPAVTAAEAATAARTSRTSKTSRTTPAPSDGEPRRWGHAPGRRRARREPGDPARAVAPVVSRAGRRERLAGRPVRPRPAR